MCILSVWLVHLNYCTFFIYASTCLYLSFFVWPNIMRIFNLSYKLRHFDEVQWILLISGYLNTLCTLASAGGWICGPVLCYIQVYFIQIYNTWAFHRFLMCLMGFSTASNSMPMRTLLGFSCCCLCTCILSSLRYACMRAGWRYILLPHFFSVLPWLYSDDHIISHHT